MSEKNVMYLSTMELADRIVEAVKVAGHWPEKGGVAEVDYALPSYSTLPDNDENIDTPHS